MRRDRIFGGSSVDTLNAYQRRRLNEVVINLPVRGVLVDGIQRLSVHVTEQLCKPGSK
jgi:hypothetical protein